jgi:Skp family chaperone for outer membrane proteins
MRLIVRAAPLALALAATAATARAQTATPAQTAAPAQSAAPAQTAAPSAVGKLAYINSQTILAQAPGREAAEKQFENEMATYRQQVQRMGDSLNTMIAEYNKQEATLAAAAKETRQKAIREKEEQYQQKTQQLQQQAQQRQVELVQPIMEQINKVIGEIRAQEGYAMILDAGSSAGVVVAADTTLNITDKVIARMKAAGPARAAAPAAKPRGTPPAGAPVSAPAGVSRPRIPPKR